MASCALMNPCMNPGGGGGLSANGQRRAAGGPQPLMAAHWGWALACASLLAARGACDVIRWCDSREFRAPEPSIRIPLEMIAAEGGAVTEVVFEVQRGERLEEAALAFCARWGFTDWQLDVLVARGHDKVAAGAVMATARPRVSSASSTGTRRRSGRPSRA